MRPPRPLLRVALTGGIATGKSTCLRRIRHSGVPTIDADELAREAVAPGTPGLAAVVSRFGPDILTSAGALDRPKLAGIVFADTVARRDLERIVHPFVFARIDEWFLMMARETGGAGFGVADVPLLFETASAHAFDVVIVAACSDERAVSRLMARDGLDHATALGRLAVQLPIGDKRARADYVIETDGDQTATNQRVDEVIAELRQRARSAGAS